MEISEFYTDTKLEEEGVWVDLFDNVQVKVASLNNPEYEKALIRAANPYSQAIARGKMTTLEVQRKIGPELIAKHILKDWSGFTKKNKELKFSVEEAKKLLTDSREFRELVIAAANDTENFRLAEVEEAAETLKN